MFCSQLADQVDRLTNLNKELRRKQRLNQAQIRNFIDQKAQLQTQQYELNRLKQCLSIAEKQNKDIVEQSKVYFLNYSY